MKTWRLMARVQRNPIPTATYWIRWDEHRDGSTYSTRIPNPEPMDDLLLCLGDSKEKCLSIFADNLPDYSLGEVKRWKYVWLEQWGYDPMFGLQTWLPVEEVSPVRFKIKLAITAQHARRKGVAV
ncbi:hypothetical protein K2X85_20625 [bacterium]|nr:hypothetical protein [bacterium]